MASSPAKRRKLSPGASVPSTPSRIPIARDARTTPSRPSFASPTKASIAKHNPQLLTRSPSRGTEGTSRPASRGNAPGNPFVASAGQMSQDAIAQPTVELENEKPQADQDQENQGAATPTAKAPGTQTRSMRSTSGGLSAAPRRRSRTPAKPAAAPPPEAELAIPGVTVPAPEDFNPFQRAGLRRSPIVSQTTTIADPEPDPESPVPQEHTIPGPSNIAAAIVSEESQVAATPNPTTVEDIPPNTQVVENRAAFNSPRNGVEPELPNVSRTRDQPLSSAPIPRTEPDLPPTPVQLGIPDPVVTTPPSGIHNTPSKKPKRRKGEQQKSSPLKPRDKPPKPVATQESTQPTEPSSQLQEQEPVIEKAVKELDLKYPTRPVEPIDPYGEKRKLRDQLLAEIEQLQADVKVAQQESERLRELQDSKTSLEILPNNKDEVIQMLQRASEPEDKKAPVTPPSIFSLINLFLPFNARPRRQEVQPAIGSKPIISHQPLSLDDPLPYLQVFSPLQYTQTTNILPPTPDSSASTTGQTTAILRHHSITASHPSGMFSARMEMIVNTHNLSIDSLAILALSPEAEAELGPWSRKRARNTDVLGRDISTICWGMGRWAEVSLERAKFWLEVEKELVDATSRKEVIKKLQKRGKRKRGNEEPEAGDDELADEADLPKKAAWTRKELLLMMGRQEMKISGSRAEVTISWTIGFDWTGEAESTIGAVARTPADWQGVDDRKSLEKIPQTFNRLLRNKGRLAAVKTIVALLMPV